MPNPAALNALYKPNPVKKLKYIGHIFSCAGWSFGKTDSNGKYPINTQPDNLKFSLNAIGIHCIIQGKFEWAILDNMCKQCRDCIDQTKTCPSFCHCRWYDNQSIKYPN